MDLSQAKKSEKLKIVHIHAQAMLKKRLSSLGVITGKEVEVLEMTIQKNTIKIAIGLSSIALRLDEAKLIEVETLV